MPVCAKQAESPKCSATRSSPAAVCVRCAPLIAAPTCLQETRRAYRQLFYTAPIGEAGISGAILFKETLYQSADDGTPFVECLKRQGVLAGIKVRKNEALRLMMMGEQPARLRQAAGAVTLQ